MSPKPKKNPRKDTPTKSVSSSPATKKLKASSGSEVINNETNMAMEVSNSAASSLPRTLDFSHDDEAPAWFRKYFDNFERRMEAMLLSKLKDQDEKIGAVEFECKNNSEEINKLSAQCKKLEEKLDDIENRARRNNIVIYGVPDSGEGENIRDVVQNVLTDFVGIEPDVVNKIQRCHRTPSFPSPGVDISQKPRMIHLAFMSYLDKEQVRKQCITKFKGESYQGKKLFVSDDFSKKIILKRKSKMETFKNLQKDGKKPFFIYPDIIKYRDANGHLVTAE